MEIWLILNGKRSGPYPDYEIRNRIEHGQMQPDEKVWHEGLPDWTALGELELFRNSFEKIEAVPALPSDFQKTVGDTKDEAKLHLGRRFWARWLDIGVFAALWWIGLYLTGKDIERAVADPWISLSMYLTYFCLEAILIQRYGTTLGKWLMGLRVKNDDASPITMKMSLWRSFRVLVMGIGFGWGLLVIVCQALSWFTARRIGKPIWDHVGKHTVIAKPLNALRVIAIVIIFFTASLLRVAVTGPHEKAALLKQEPEFEKFFKEDPLFYFPVREP